MMARMDAILILRELKADQTRVWDPSKAANKAAMSIFRELQELITSKYSKTSSPLQAIYKDICEDRLNLLLRRAMYTTSDEEIARERNGRSNQPTYNRIILRDGIESVDPPVVSADINIAELSNTNLYQHVMAHSLDYMLSLLINADQSLPASKMKNLRNAYMELNQKQYYDNPVKFRSLMSYSDSTELRNILEQMREVLKGFRDNKSRLIAKMNISERINSDNIEAAERDTIINEVLDEENTVYFKDVTLGSDSPLSLGKTSWICGNPECLQRNEAEEPMVMINNRIVTARLSLGDIRGNVFVSTPRCPHCGKYNLFTSGFLTALLKVLEEKNVALTREYKSPREGQMIELGLGMLEATKQHLQDMADNEEDPVLRNNYILDLEQSAELNEAGYNISTTFITPGVEDYDELFADTMQELRKIEAISGAPRKVTDTVAEEDAGASSTIRTLRETYKDRLLVNDDGMVSLKPSALFIGFAQMFLSNFVDLGYTKNDLIQSICSTDTKYYTKLLQYQQCVVALAAIEKLSLLIDNIGYSIQGNLIVKLGELENYYAQVLDMPQGLNSAINTMIPKIEKLTSNLTIAEVNDKELLSHFKENEKERLTYDEASTFWSVDTTVQRLVKSQVEEYLNKLSDLTYGVLERPVSLETFTVKAYCEIAQGNLNRELENLKFKLSEAALMEAETKGAVITKGNYTHPVSSPVYLLSADFKEELCDKLYFRMLKNTLRSANLQNTFNMYLKRATMNQYSLWESGIRNIKSILMGLEVPEGVRLMFANNFKHDYSMYYQITGAGLSNFMKVTQASISDISNGITAEPSDTYDLFCNEVLCDLVNAVTTPRLLKELMYLSEDTFSEIEEVSKEEIQDSALVSLAYMMPEITQDLKNSVLSFMSAYRDINTSDLLDADDYVSIAWDESMTPQEEEECGIDLNTIRAETLTDILVFYERMLRSELNDDLREYLSRCEAEG